MTIRRVCNSSGFSLIELMITLIILLTIAAAIFQTINMTTQRSASEQTKVDMFQEAREFMDQMSRDLRQAGYPNPRNMDPSVFTNPIVQDHRAAVGLVQVDTGDLWFEGDVDGSGTVSAVRYHYDTVGTNCPCLKRSQLPKIDGDPYSSQTTPSYEVEVQGVQSSNIFTAYTGGTPVGGLPVTTAMASGTTIARIDTVQAVLTLQASTIDPQTHKYPVTTLVTTVRLNNCSQAAAGQKTSCQ